MAFSHSFIIKYQICNQPSEECLNRFQDLRNIDHFFQVWIGWILKSNLLLVRMLKSYNFMNLSFRFIPIFYCFIITETPNKLVWTPSILFFNLSYMYFTILHQFIVFFFQHFLIRAKLSELGYFRRFPTNLIQYIRKAFKSHNKTGLGLELT